MEFCPPPSPNPHSEGNAAHARATEQRYTRRPYPGQANSSVAARIINLFPWQPRRDPHHWLRRFSHPRAIALYGRTANYRCRDTLHRSQHSIVTDYRVISPSFPPIYRPDPRRAHTHIQARARRDVCARARARVRRHAGTWLLGLVQPGTLPTLRDTSYRRTSRRNQGSGIGR